MKLIIAGGRDYQLTESDYYRLICICETNGVTEIVSGHCPTGADACGEKWAQSRGLSVKIFPADWYKLGKAAGPRRNREMAQYADAVVLFPGGSGTQSMYREAKLENIKIFDLRGEK